MIVPHIRFESQGRLVKLRVEKTPSSIERKNRSKRGKVTTFTRKSRKRLLELMARLDLAGAALGKPIIFITLTYAQKFPHPAIAKANLRAFLERVRRFAPAVSGIWRVEYQKRGAPHFHMLLFNLPYLDKDELARWWGEIIHQDYWDTSGFFPRVPFTRIEAIRSGRRATFYLSKYVAKVDDTPSAPARFSEDAEEESSGFNTMPYLHAGRWWGLFNSSLLPFAELIEMSLAMSTSGQKKVFYDFKRLMARKYQGISRSRVLRGGSLFVDSCDKWVDYWLHLWLEHSQDID